MMIKGNKNSNSIDIKLDEERRTNLFVKHSLFYQRENEEFNIIKINVDVGAQPSATELCRTHFCYGWRIFSFLPQYTKRTILEFLMR